MSLYNIWVIELKRRQTTRLTKHAMSGIIPGLTLGEIADQLSQATGTTYTIEPDETFVFTHDKERKEP